ncbi:hypothetical protein B0H14DRAFT_3161085 [Mycena olivaceomarginata]|nr:hypothetical protein B0H14DRAFT_3161085 [Mycena olivaceomarginata]
MIRVRSTLAPSPAQHKLTSSWRTTVPSPGMFRRSRGTVPSVRDGHVFGFSVSITPFSHSCWLALALETIERGADAAPLLFCITSHPAVVVAPLALFAVCELICFWVFWACSARHTPDWVDFEMPKDISEDPALPFPGEYGPTGFATQYIRLKTLSKPQLSDHCKTFKLPYTGNMATLTNRLEDFSKDKSRWERLIPGATNAHKGPRKPNEDKKTKPKISTIRREHLFQDADGVRVLNAPVTERSKDLRTAEEKAAILPWAQRIVSKYPYQPNPDNSNTNASIYPQPTSLDNDGTARSMPCAGSPQQTNGTPQNNQTTELPLDFIAPHCRGDSHTVQPTPPPDRPSMNPDTRAPVIDPATPIPPPSRSERNSDASTTSDVPMVSPSSVDAGSNAAPLPTRILQLAGGKSVTFDESDIPDPPAVSYAKNIEDLLGVWNDNSPQWNGTSPLKIQNVPIPLVHYPLVYKYWKGSQWKGVKKVWFEWKILVQAMSRDTTDNFWTRYSAPDKSGTLRRLKYTPLLKQLESERKAENQRLVDLALAELTPEQLTYRKGSTRVRMTKPAMIAAHYRKLKGLSMEDEEDEEGD